MRLTPDQRRAMIVAAGVLQGNTFGLEILTTDHVAASCKFKTAASTVKHYFPTKTELWAAIANHPDASKELKNQARLIGVI